jgi:hypothetical protein
MTTNTRISAAIALSLLLWGQVSHPAEKVLTDDQIAALPESVQQFVHLMREVRSKGASGIKAVSFRQTEQSYSLTQIVDGEDPPMYFAIITPQKSGAALSFKSTHSCKVTDLDNRLSTRVITVDGRKVSTYVFCGSESDTSPPGELFMIETAPGREYVHGRFVENEFVFVDFGGVRVPFDTDGFEDVWNKAAEPAL